MCIKSREALLGKGYEERCRAKYAVNTLRDMLFRVSESMPIAGHL